MARPKKTPEELRDDQLKVRLTMAERVEIERNARLLGISPAEFTRRRTLGYRLPVSLIDQQRTAVLATALLRVGANLNQWTHAINAGMPPFDLLQGLLFRIKSILDGIYGPDDHLGREQL